MPRQIDCWGFWASDWTVHALKHVHSRRLIDSAEILAANAVS